MDAVQMWEMLLTSSNPMVSMDQSVQIYREAHGFCTMIRSDGPFTRAIAFSNARDLKALTKELALAETPFKVSGLVVKVKTNQLDSFADLAAFIMNG